MISSGIETIGIGFKKLFEEDVVSIKKNAFPDKTLDYLFATDDRR